MSLRGDAGGAAAEFAVVLPAVLLVLALCLGGVRAATVRLLAQDAAADAARSLARGDPPGSAAARVARAVPSARLSKVDRGDLVCATVTAEGAAGIPVSATSCALGGGR